MRNTSTKGTVESLAIIVISLLLGFSYPTSARAESRAVFKMREVSAFQSARSRELVRGQNAQCETEPQEKVKVYPKLKSKRPLYGAVKFDRNFFQPESGIEYHFVVDETGDAPLAEEPSLLEKLLDALKGASDEKSKLDEAKNFYRQILADGPLRVPEVRQQAEELGIAKRTLERARQALGIKAKQTGFGETKEWEWYLP